MKNMFFVINKEKIYAYVVSIVTIVILFFMSHVLNSDLNTVEETYINVEQSTNSENNTQNNELSTSSNTQDNEASNSQNNNTLNDIVSNDGMMENNSNL